MLISLEWINDFTTLPKISPEEIGRAFTRHTAEVEEVIVPGKELDQIVIAEVLSAEKHPDADKLKLCKVTIDGKSEIDVVCGAPNVRAGLKVAYAPVGSTLPGGFVLEKKKIRGVLSNGMICSERELGLGEDHDGILELAADLKVGAKFKEILQKDAEIVLEVDNKSLTHRPDLWGHYGMAREFATIYSSPLKDFFSKEWRAEVEAHYTDEQAPITVKVESDAACLGYFGLSVSNIKVEPSPEWMQKRLIAAGLRPINNMVDIGNYVMLELGQPLHMFDRSKISGKQIIVKRVSDKQNFEALDESVVELHPGDTVVADQNQALVVGGIIGGTNSGIADDTKDIFIEAANWNAAEIRRLSTRIGIRTDSSQRFEKSLDTLQTDKAVLRAAELVLKLCPDAKVVGKLQYDGPDLSQTKALTIETEVAAFSELLGVEVNKEQICTTLESIGFKTTPNGDKLSVVVPSYRATKDVEMEVDLIEEVGRFIGYDNIEPKSPRVELAPTRLSKEKQLFRKVQDFMVMRAHALEVFTYPLTSEKALTKAAWPNSDQCLKLKNALSSDSELMRPSMLPSMLEAIALNQKQYQSFRMFEIGRAYLPKDKNFSEERTHLALVLYSRDKNQYIETVNITENFLQFCNMPAALLMHSAKLSNPVVPVEWPGAHPIEYQHIKLMGKNQGAVLSLHPSLLQAYKIKGYASICLLDVTDFVSASLKDKLKFTPISKYPSASFDCTVLTGKRDEVQRLIDLVRAIGIKEIVDVKIVTCFDLSAEDNAVTVRTTFHHPEKTLSGDFLKDAETKIIEQLANAGFFLKS
ncbi:MAG: phenylalanine--tRNA ligase subunit beta [Deltaproteobacteria bacterium]|nr:phenylalanine--tRNA ligase subunit beta [Deltaproteobacteria bacterium]